LLWSSNRKCKTVEQKKASCRAEVKQKIQDGRAKAKQQMRDGRAKKCKMAEQKLNKKCKTAEQKNVRWPSKSFFFLMRGGRAKKCKVVELKLNKKKCDGRAKKCKAVEQKNATRNSRTQDGSDAGRSLPTEVGSGPASGLQGAASEHRKFQK
jgi:hypothetical protein